MRGGWSAVESVGGSGTGGLTWWSGERCDERSKLKAKVQDEGRCARVFKRVLPVLLLTVLIGGCARFEVQETRGESVSNGIGHACAVLSDGRVACWGSNFKGELGDGTTEGSSTLMIASSLSNVVGVSVGSEYTCAVDAAGEVWCWGRNSQGQLGDGTTLDRLTPVRVQGLSGVVGVEASSDVTCAVLDQGEVACWGRRSSDSGIASVTEPVSVAGLGDVVQLSSMGMGWCALTRSGTVECWDAGFLEGAEPSGVRIDPEVIGVHRAVDIAVGYGFSCAVTDDGLVHCWGFNDVGQLGMGSTEDVEGVVTVLGVRDAVALSAGAMYACALSNDGTVSCWGAYETGAPHSPGASPEVPTPVVVPALTNAIEISAGLSTTCARTASGAIVCWGLSGLGLLGTGLDRDSTPIPVEVVGIS